MGMPAGADHRLDVKVIISGRFRGKARVKGRWRLTASLDGFVGFQGAFDDISD